MITIPLQPIPAQTLSVSLAGQSCVISVYQKSTGIFLDLTANNVVIMTTALCLTNVILVRFPYLGFIGDLVFIDTQGVDDPQYTGLGARWQLMYLSPAEVAANT